MKILNDLEQRIVMGYNCTPHVSTDVTKYRVSNEGLYKNIKLHSEFLMYLFEKSVFFGHSVCKLLQLLALGI